MHAPSALGPEKRLPSDAEALSACLIDLSVHESVDEHLERMIQSQISNGQVPVFSGFRFTSDVEDESLVVARRGPR